MKKYTQLQIETLLIFSKSWILDTRSIKMGKIYYLFLQRIGFLICLDHGYSGHVNKLLLKLLLVQLMHYVTYFEMQEVK